MERKKELPLPGNAVYGSRDRMVLITLDASARMATGSFDIFRTRDIPSRHPPSVTRQRPIEV